MYYTKYMVPASSYSKKRLPVGRSFIQLEFQLEEEQVTWIEREGGVCFKLGILLLTNKLIKIKTIKLRQNAKI